MTDRPEAPKPVSFYSHTIDLTRVKGPIAFFPVAPEFLPVIGQITIGWSYFEREHDNYLRAALATNGTVVPGWERRNFRKRRELFRSELKVLFQPYPKIIEHFHNMLAEAATIYWKRNLLVHGKLWARIHANGTIAVFAEGRHNGRDIKLSWVLGAMKDLNYDLAHLCGNIASLIDPSDTFPPLSSLEKSVLRTFAETHHLHPPKQEGP